MSGKSSKPGIGRLVLHQLSHPIKLRVALCLGMIFAWQVGFFGPLNDDVVATTARIGLERRRIATAQEVEQLKKAQTPHQDAVGSADGVNELIQFLMTRIRSSPVRLVDLIPGKAKDLGPFQAISLNLKLNGTYKDIDDLLGWIESNPRLLRVDTIQMKPNSREPGQLNADLTLVALAERSTTASAKADVKPPVKSIRKSGSKPADRPLSGPETRSAPKPASKSAPAGPVAKSGTIR